MSSDEVPKNDSKKCIVEAAAKLFARLGLDKCSTREIAKEADANISLISYYFGGKEGLYKEVLRDYAMAVKEGVQNIVQVSEKSPITLETFKKTFEMMVGNMIWYRTQNPEVSKIFAQEKLMGLPHSRQIHSEVFYPLAQKFLEIFIEGQRQGFIKSEINPPLFFITLSEGIWGFFNLMECQTEMRQGCEALVQNHEEIKKQIMQIYLTGVLK